MRTVWQYALRADCTLELPKGAEILSVQAVGEEPFLYALVTPSAETVKRRFVYFGTARRIEMENVEYLGTVSLAVGAALVHVFEVLE